MAKKKAKVTSKQGSPIRWIIAIVVVVIVIALFARNGGEEPTQVAEQPVVQEVEKGALASAATPEFNKACKGIAIGLVPGSKSVADNVVTATFKNSAKVTLEGAYFEFGSGDNMVYRKNTDAIGGGDTMEYVVDLNEVASELGSAVMTFTVYPSLDGKACVNSRVFVVS